MLALHVSDLTAPSSGAFYKLYLQIRYVVIRVLLDTSSHYEVIGSWTAYVLVSVQYHFTIKLCIVDLMEVGRAKLLFINISFQILKHSTLKSNAFI